VLLVVLGGGAGVGEAVVVVVVGVVVVGKALAAVVEAPVVIPMCGLLGTGTGEPLALLVGIGVVAVAGVTTAVGPLRIVRATTLRCEPRSKEVAVGGVEVVAEAPTLPTESEVGMAISGAALATAAVAVVVLVREFLVIVVGVAGCELLLLQGSASPSPSLHPSCSLSSPDSS
jgi:hypothetical protein